MENKRQLHLGMMMPDEIEFCATEAFALEEPVLGRRHGLEPGRVTGKGELHAIVLKKYHIFASS